MNSSLPLNFKNSTTMRASDDAAKRFNIQFYSGAKSPLSRASRDLSHMTRMGRGKEVVHVGARELAQGEGAEAMLHD
jgi:hypothetical protein